MRQEAASSKARPWPFPGASQSMLSTGESDGGEEKGGEGDEVAGEPGAWRTGVVGLRDTGLPDCTLSALSPYPLSNSRRGHWRGLWSGVQFGPCNCLGCSVLG